jgi:ParB-like chromosome segregation protein Spo0J
MKQLDWHPAANLFPALWMTDKPAYEELVNDIKANGLLEPIWLHDGLVLDGRNRYRACLDAGVEPQFREWAGQGGDVVSFVISLNLKRRHLNSGQRALVGFHALAMLEAEAKKRQQAAGEQYGRGMDEKLQEILPEAIEPKPQARDQAAALVGVSGKYVSDIKAINKKAPELLKKIENGSMTIPEAKRQMNEPKPEPVKPPIRWSVIGPMLLAAARMLRNQSDREEAIELILRIVDETEQA